MAAGCHSGWAADNSETRQISPHCAHRVDGLAAEAGAAQKLGVEFGLGAFWQGGSEHLHNR